MFPGVPQEIWILQVIMWQSLKFRAHDCQSAKDAQKRNWRRIEVCAKPSFYPCHFSKPLSSCLRVHWSYSFLSFFRSLVLSSGSRLSSKSTAAENRRGPAVHVKWPFCLASNPLCMIYCLYSNLRSKSGAFFPHDPRLKQTRFLCGVSIWTDNCSE